VSYQPDVLLARDQGADVVAVGALVQKPLTSLMSLGAKGVTDPKQLAGKTVGTAGIPYQSAYLKAILARATALQRAWRYDIQGNYWVTRAGC